ncbi:transmembrane protein Tmp21 homologue [Plasmodium ovale curtisi]|uniref:Transmembrane protein Tmp21 homologue n=1 Tax=Plasmodium ovale curtisi TaxID=864141 RepID=A0A1A8WTN4_PLAOA|nr:transmembrane protein Tmp21 homologue [Plasmodium ovale curtisi]SBS96320.1 transmembrane protein Tmp21 homologue [Plasmodium ovale curtisi]
MFVRIDKHGKSSSDKCDSDKCDSDERGSDERGSDERGKSRPEKFPSWKGPTQCWSASESRTQCCTGHHWKTFTKSSCTSEQALVNGVEIYITLRPNKLKCIKERINKDTLVVSKFRTDNKNSLVSIFIYDIDVNERNFTFSQKQPIFETINKHDIKTAFTTFYSSSYSFCAYNKTKKLIDVHFEIKYGTEARDYTKIAKTEHLNEATIILKKIVDRMNIFHINLKKIKADEEKEKKSNDKLNDTLMWFSIINILIIIVAAILQDFYFKRFFTSKKII